MFELCFWTRLHSQKPRSGCCPANNKERRKTLCFKSERYFSKQTNNRNRNHNIVINECKGIGQCLGLIVKLGINPVVLTRLDPSPNVPMNDLQEEGVPGDPTSTRLFYDIFFYTLKEKRAHSKYQFLCGRGYWAIYAAAEKDPAAEKRNGTRRNAWMVLFWSFRTGMEIFMVFCHHYGCVSSSLYGFCRGICF